MPPINLLKFLPVLAEGGTEGQVMNLVDRLDLSKFDVRFACFNRAGRFLPFLEARGIPVTPYAIKRFYDLRALRQQARLANDIRRHRVDIVHSYNFYGNVFAVPAGRLARMPVVVASIRSMGEMYTPLQRRVHRYVCRLADCVLTNAEAIRQSLVAEGYDAAKIRVIRNGIDVRSLRGTADGGPRFRLAFALPADAPIVAVLARLGTIKGLEYFLEAAVGVAQRFPRARFALVGGGTFIKDGRKEPRDYRRELEAMARRLGLEGRVVFTGVRNDVADVLSQVAVSVLPSLSEGIPNTALESMAAGVPVVATRVGGIPEAVEDGATGLLVAPRDPAALARAIGLVLEDRDLAWRLGQAGRERVIQHFGLDDMVRQTEALYASLLERRRATGSLAPRPQEARPSLGRGDGRSHPIPRSIYHVFADARRPGEEFVMEAKPLTRTAPMQEHIDRAVHDLLASCPDPERLTADERRGIIARYSAVLEGNFIYWMTGAYLAVASAEAHAIIQDNLREEVRDNHPGMLRRFAIAAHAVPTDLDSFAVYRHLENVRRFVGQLSAVKIVLMMAFFEGFITRFMPYLADLAKRQGSSEYEYTDVHGVCDVVHTQELFRALEAEMALAPDLEPEPKLLTGVELLRALIQRIITTGVGGS